MRIYIWGYFCFFLIFSHAATSLAEFDAQDSSRLFDIRNSNLTIGQNTAGIDTKMVIVNQNLGEIVGDTYESRLQLQQANVTLEDIEQEMYNQTAKWDEQLADMDEAVTFLELQKDSVADILVELQTESGNWETWRSEQTSFIAATEANWDLMEDIENQLLSQTTEVFNLLDQQGDQLTDMVNGLGNILSALQGPLQIDPNSGSPVDVEVTTDNSDVITWLDTTLLPEVDSIEERLDEVRDAVDETTSAVEDGSDNIVSAIAEGIGGGGTGGGGGGGGGTVPPFPELEGWYEEWPDQETVELPGTLESYIDDFLTKAEDFFDQITLTEETIPSQPTVSLQIQVLGVEYPVPLPEVPNPAREGLALLVQCLIFVSAVGIAGDFVRRL